MIRKASIMKVYSEHYEEYEKRHDELWPEMRTMLKEHGVHNYSIFLDKQTGMLFAYALIESEDKWEAISQTEICQKWWNYMKDIMKVNSDNSPESISLKEVFHLE